MKEWFDSFKLGVTFKVIVAICSVVVITPVMIACCMFGMMIVLVGVPLAIGASIVMEVIKAVSEDK